MSKKKYWVSPTFLITFILTCAVLTYIIYHLHQIPYTVSGKCLDKFTSINTHDHVQFNVVVKYDDGEVKTLEDVTAENYYSYTVGQKYYYTFYRTIWK